MARQPTVRPAEPGSAPAGTARTRRLPAPLWLLIVLYLTLIFAPLGFAFLHGPVHAQATIDTVASSLGMVAFAALLVDFLFSGRTRWISDRIGVRSTMRMHRWVAYAIISCIAIHPFLYTAPDSVSWPWFNAEDATLILGNWSLFTGLAAWILTAGIVLVAVDHKKLPGSYRSWRLMHAGSALLLGALIAVHAISAGGYSGQTGLAAYWIVLLLAGLLVLTEMFLVQPWRRRRGARVRHRGTTAADRAATVAARDVNS